MHPVATPGSPERTSPVLVIHPALARLRETSSARPAPRALVRSVAVLAGLAVGLVVTLLRSAGLLHGAAALVVLALLALAVPTSRELPRRILLLAGVTMAAVPALWWWNLPVGGVGRATCLLAALAGGLTAAMLWDGPRAGLRRARAAVPRWRRTDLVLLAAGAAGAWVAAGWLRLSTGSAALSALLPAWDSSAHVDMVLMLRRHGAVVAALGAGPGGEHWKFAEYPEGYHAVAATAVELLEGARPGTMADEVLAFAHVQGLLVVALAVLLAAAVCALPALRPRPTRALLLSAFVVAAFVAGPGAAAVRDGFANFALAAALAACAVLLATSMPRPLMPLHLLALCGLVVGVAQTWVLLLCVAVPAVALAALPLRRREWRSNPRVLALAGVVVLVGLVGLAQTARTLAVLDAGAVLVIPGAITTAEPGILVTVVLGAVAVSLWPRGPRSSWSAVVPVAGAATVVALAVVQLQGAGTLSYYFWKLFTGVALVCTATIAAQVAAWPTTPRPATAAARLRLGLAVGAGAIAVTQVFGFTGLGRALLPASADHEAAAAALLQAAETVDRLPARTVSYLGGDGLHPINAQQWVLALTGRWTVEANDTAGALVGADGAPRTASDAAAVLLASPDAMVVVDPRLADGLRTDPTLAASTDRVVTW